MCECEISLEPPWDFSSEMIIATLFFVKHQISFEFGDLMFNKEQSSDNSNDFKEDFKADFKADERRFF